MFNHSWFYNETLRRYVIVFGTLFNDLTVRKRAQDGSVIKEVRVPLSYGPKEKFLARRDGDPDFNNAINQRLPRISYEITGVTRGSDRKLNSQHRYTIPDPTDPRKFQSTWMPVPYDVGFQLNIMTRSIDDGSQILEQILPFFTPEWTNAVKILDNVDIILDCPVILNGVTNTDSYEGDWQERRAVIWTLDFTMKCYFFGPTIEKKVIKIANTNIHDTTVDDKVLTKIRVAPGLDANGNPTTDPSLSINPLDIDADDNWDYTVTIEEQ